MLAQVATLRTPTTCIEVRDGSWNEPMEHVTKMDRASMSLLFFEHGAGEASFEDPPLARFRRVGRVVFTPPNREVVGRSTPVGRLRVVSCVFDGSYCERIVGSFAGLSKSQLLGCLDVPSTVLPAMLSRLMTEAIQPGFVSAALVETLGQALLVEWSHAVLCREATHGGRGRLQPRHFRIIDEYLATSSGEAPSVSAIARACGFSERYFAKLFREQTGQPIGQYLRSAQMAKAQALLLQTDFALKEIAYRLGFSTPGNFSDAFRAATGETPARFRSANRAPFGKREAGDLQ